MNWLIEIKDNRIDTLNLLNVNSDKLNPEYSYFIDGHIVPRFQYFNRYKDLSQNELLIELFMQFGFDFIHYIKGIFCIVIFSKDEFYFFNDRHGINKCFVLEDNEKIIIASSIELIAKDYKLELDHENIAMFTMFSHFLHGQTMFKNIWASTPATIIKFSKGKIIKGNYWHPKELVLHREKNSQSLKYYAEFWKELFHNQIEFLNPQDIAITVTGGNDSRMALAALLSLNKKPKCFSYGNPKSYDCVIAEKISEEIDLNYTNYFVAKPTKEWFQTTGNEIITVGETLVNIHRAHRLDAVEKEKVNYPEIEMLITGLVGGEYIKGMKYDNVQIPKLLKDFEVKPENEIQSTIKEVLTYKGIKVENIDISLIIKRIKSFLNEGNGYTSIEKNFIYGYLYYGGCHHVQDSTVFSNKIKYLFNPFMDIDFLEVLSKSKHWYLNQPNTLIKKIFHSLFLVGITEYLSPELSRVPYAKRGQYTANDLMKNKFKYLLKRFRYFVKKDKEQYPSNFTMGDWLYEFANEQLNNNKGEVLVIFDLKFLQEKLETVKSKTQEEYWHIITNPINIMLNYEHYKKI